jgi:hypothetical protein
VTVNAAITASSPDNHGTAITLESVSSNGGGADDVAGAAIGTDDRVFQVRAERSGAATRTYTATYRATDTVTGASTTATDTVVVPRDAGTAALFVLLSVLETLFPGGHPLIDVLRALLGL